ncbi:MAG: FHA domain-containing protein, partial [Acidobacteriota bacterium]
MPTVRMTRAGVVEAELPLARVDVRLGRATDNDLTLKDPDKTLSRHHAELRREGETWFYLDLNSANGSWVGDQKVMRQELLPGTTILLGDYQLTVVDVLAGGDSAVEDVNATRIVRPGDTAVAMKPAVAAPAKPARPTAPPQVGGAV